MVWLWVWACCMVEGMVEGMVDGQGRLATLLGIGLGYRTGALAMRAWTPRPRHLHDRQGHKRKSSDFNEDDPGEYVNSRQPGGPRKRGLAALR
jgi:hypothetical protein